MIQQISTNIQKQYMEAVESYALDQSDWLEDVNKNIRRQEHFFVPISSACAEFIGKDCSKGW
ncbi:MAG: hypothetical protein L6W00_14340 [Lentisphaeria bacterium]|nr:MAG: hypothetical protein L6W00_14340 [Lentisphaeria bacterium]